jgi:glycosyltransferase involved in cell wall biosynthesis
MTSTAISIKPHHCSQAKVTPIRSRSGRILLLSTNLGIGGGAEEQVQQLALSLKTRGWTVGVISMLPFKTLPQELSDSDINIGTLNMKRGVADPRSVMQLARIIRRFRPDVVHSHMTHANLLARVTRPFAPMPALISTLHGSKMHSVKGGSTRMREIGHRITDRWTDVTTTICGAAAESCIQDGAVPAGRVMVLHNGVDTERYQPRPDVREQMRRELGVAGKLVWLAVGRFELPKNYALMIRAFSFALQHSRRDMVLLICGAGSMQSQVEAQVRELGLEGHIRFLGIRRDIPQVMNAADAYVLSSDTEGLPMVLLQASASALPIVATNVGGNAEVVQHNRTGFLAPSGDTMALADAIERTSGLNAFDRSRLGGAGRQFTHENFGIGHIVDQWEELYRQLLTRNKKSQRNQNA